MPPRYRQLFRGPTVHEHAAIVARRGRAPAHAEIWRRLAHGGVVVCVVADDQPGLLSHLGTALTTQSLDLLAAQVYGRVAPRGAEVVDLLWLRRDTELGSPVVDADMARLAGLLGGLATGELRSDGRALDPRRTSAASATLVHFDDEKGSKGSTSLILETVERPGLFRAVLDALVRAGVQLRGSRRASGGAGRVVHRFVIAEGNGLAPDQYRRGILQAEVLRVVELVAHRAPPRAAQEPTATRRDGVFIDEAHPLFT
jgi:UTP:GlnB (protein PII) uridylyltransferase